MNGVGELRNVVRIDEQGVSKLIRGAGERAQNEHSAFVFAGGHKFLSDEIHAVVERSDHAHRSRVVETRDLLMRMVFLEKDDGFPLRRLEGSVDALGFRADLVKKTLIALDIRAAGSADLHEREAPLIGGV